jgi:hypothetical protein
LTRNSLGAALAFVAPRLGLRAELGVGVGLAALFTADLASSSSSPNTDAIFLYRRPPVSAANPLHRVSFSYRRVQPANDGVETA